jgi:dUTP pyrophosphatase
VEKINIKIKLLNGHAIVPVQRDGDVGADVHSTITTIVNPGSTERIPLGLALEIPLGYAGYILPRSGMSSRGRTVFSPPIDPGYRGEVNAIAHNSSPAPWAIYIGDRIAQLVIMPAPRVVLDPCAELTESGRGANGFGSTGIRPIGVDADGSPVRRAGNGG